ncbi:MAG: molybdate ABC transporter substrate-binding protein [Gammaproteobacteria bacterium]|jgi:molybdate transport system substrate-binding protein|nr:molybdate ABC transporter substrate-binding protein [Gammaproteobacteria bacterium]MBT4378959.1 molybdate ABC transporter substrate-binding protein [Gammaproteobacteria bacterium]MBT4615231.1 molybdate ABC transporter substrate-binding protein [Gammaproteobacteria bacterium]MBT5199842.1 molybdate ABC transporter substrate-binding protein [Gammaproteobacteria bacterium]MBT5445716.1 molybdate ABC transporter substrate-binding protein [Gammaproteobacteria bacterium]
MTSSNGWIRRKVLIAGVLIPLFVHSSCYADDLRIGVASNFRSTLEQIATGFKLAHNIEVEVSAASTGALFAQVKSGAPFDILFAADSIRPALLESEGHTRLRRTYAYGQLVFWTPGKPANETTLKQYKGTMAIANPRHAPYGKAATDTLELMQVKSDRVVYGTNIAQAFNFVRTGNAPAGLIALSQIKYMNVPAIEFWVVPPESYAPIEQQLVVLKNASMNAELFVAYTFDPGTTRLIEKSGYLVSDTGNQPGTGADR